MRLRGETPAARRAVRGELGVALAVLALLWAVASAASAASAATVGLGSGPNCFDDPDGRPTECPTLIEVKARAGETNRIVVTRASKRRLLIRDTGAALRVSSSSKARCRRGRGGVLCPRFDLFVDLGDGDASLSTPVGGDVVAGSGADAVRVSGGVLSVDGGPGADSLESTDRGTLALFYATALVGLRVDPDGVANDGAGGEGDNVRGEIGSIWTGRGDDVLVGDERQNRLEGGLAGRDLLMGLGGNDRLIGGGGDTLDGGPGRYRFRATVGDRLLTSDGDPDRAFCGGIPLPITFDSLDTFDECAQATDFSDRPLVVLHNRVKVSLYCPRGSPSDCLGSVQVFRRVHKRRQVLGQTAFAPTRPGTRRTVTIRMMRSLPLGRATDVYVETQTQRLAPRSTTHSKYPETLIRPRPSR